MKALRLHSDGTAMTQISIRNLDPETAARLRRNAQRRGQSLNRYLQSVLRHTAVGDKPAAKTQHNDLDALAGTWTRAQGEAFARATAPFAEVDASLWR